MRERLRPISVSRKSRRKTRIFVFILAWLSLPMSGFLLPSNMTSAAGTMQLVRLNVTADSGLVRIEITADGSFDDATVEHYTRGRQTVIRIRGARSLLKHSYEINDSVAREVRTLSGESGGEPYVDVLIALGAGATIAQKKSFNRLVIGVALDFARLRRRAPATAESAKSRPAAAVERGVSVASLGTTEELKTNATVNADAALRPVINYPAETLGAAGNVSDAQQLASASAPPSVFRGRTIWSNFPRTSFNFSRQSAAGLAPTFFLPPSGAANPASAFINFIQTSLDPPGSRLGVWVPGTTASERDEVGGRPWGAGYLRPSFQLDATYDDNFFYRSEDGRRLGIFTLAPRLEYEIPGTEHALRVAYEPRLRRLTNGEWANGHVFDFDARFEVTPVFRLAVRDHFVRSPLDAREYDPAGETYIVGDTFTRNDAGLRAEYQLTGRSRLAFDAAYNIVRWSEDHIAGPPLFIDYDELAGGLSYERDLSEQTTGTLAFTFSNGSMDAPLRPQFDGLGDSRRYVFEIGGRTQVSETSGMAFRVGYERAQFRNAPEQNDYSGLVFDLRFRRDLTPSTIFELAALRKTQVSAFNLEGGNARLLSTGGSARLERTEGENFKFALGLNYQQLGFPLAVVPNSTASGGVLVGQFAGERRKDHLYGFSLEAGYRFSELLKTRLIYSFSRRDSTIPVFTFNRNRLSLVFDIGRRNEVRGRPF
jgi:hypothetical protein